MIVFFVSAYNSDYVDVLVWEGSVEVGSVARIEQAVVQRMRDDDIDTLYLNLDYHYIQMHKLGGD